MTADNNDGCARDATRTLTALAAPFHLARGRHASPEEGLCLLELVAFLQGQEHTDRPAGVSPAIASAIRFVNDRTQDAARQQLLRFVDQLPDTDDEHEQERIETFACVAVLIVGMALGANGYHRHARAIVNAKSYGRAEVMCNRARQAVVAKGGPNPKLLALDHALYSAAGALWAAANARPSAGHLCMSTALQAKKAGVPGILEIVLDTLGAVLAIGTPDDAPDDAAPPPAGPAGAVLEKYADRKDTSR